MCGVLPAHRRAGLYWRYAAQGHYSALAGCAGAPIAANEAADPDRDRARTPGAGLPCQETRRPTAERATAGTVARQDRWDDVGRRGGRPLVERALPVAGVGIRGGYALNRRRPARCSAASDGARLLEQERLAPQQPEQGFEMRQRDCGDNGDSRHGDGDLPRPSQIANIAIAARWSERGDSFHQPEAREATNNIRRDAPEP